MIPINALMTIQVRVLSAQAIAQLRAVEAQSRRTALGGLGMFNRQAGLGIPILTKYGSQAQWAGRQLTYNFGLPLIAAGTAAAHWALENEKAMTRVAKVYGDGSAKMDRWAKTELPALEEAFESLSNQFGVHQAEVINIAGDWAAAGASGVALAKIVKTTLETMILGEINAAEATKNLIAIQAQYGLSVEELSDTIGILNMTENQTGTTMADLMNAMSRSAGTAREAGMSIEELVAITAALVPATGSAATAGNGLRTIISRLLTPTEEAKDLLREMNIAVGDSAWESMNATQRLETLARGYEDLSGVQKNNIATYVASRYQLNRFQTLMRAIVNENSYYNKSLRATADSQAVFNQKQKELRRIMESNPQKLQQQWTILQNAMADVIQPLLPYLVYIAQKLADAAQAFADLDINTQKWIIAALASVVAFGLLLRLGGALGVLLGYMAFTGHLVAVALGGMAKILLGPVVGAFKLLGTVGVALLAPIAFMSRMITAIIGAMWGMTRAVSAVVWSWATLLNMLTVISSVVTFFATRVMGTAMFAPFVAALVAARVALYVWLHTTLARVGAWVMLMGARMTLLAVWIKEAAMAFWFFLTVPGALSGRLIAMWAAISAAMVRVWAVVTTAMTVVWATMLRAMTFLMLNWHRGIVVVFAAVARGFAMIGPIIVAAVTRLWPLLMSAFVGLATLLQAAAGMIIAAVTSPIGIAILAALGIVYYFRDELAGVWDSVVDYFRTTASDIGEAFAPLGNFFADLAGLISDAFWALPESIRDVMITVVTIIRDAALQVYEWFSYLNPWARHSPSLVDSVRSGMDAVEREYSRAAGMGSIFATAAKHLAAFKKIAAANGRGEFSDERADVKKFMPSGLGLFDALVNDLGKLRPIMARQEAAMNEQQAVVDRWKGALDRSNASLNKQQDELDRLKAKLTAVQDVYDMHEQTLQNYADAPIKGMRKFSDEIFENEIAQKRLQIEMAKWKQANGDIEDMSSRLQTLYGDIEMLRGEANDLRMAGAGSEVLGPINDQIKAMEVQARAAADAINNAPVDQMQKQLEELQAQGQLMQLEYDVKYDPMTRQIEQLANAQTELKFDEITEGIKREREAMDALQPRMDALTKAVNQQQAVVDSHTAARDRLQARYDAEQNKLDALNDKYQRTADLVREIESALRDMATAATSASGAAGRKPGEVGNAVSSFRAGAGMDFPEVGGKAAIERLTGGNETDLINQFVEETNSELAGMIGDFDMFAGIRKWWDKTWSWIKTNIGPIVSAIGGGITRAVDGIGNPFAGISDSAVGKTVGRIIDVFADMGRWFAKWGGKLWRLFDEDIIGIWHALRDAAVRAWKKLGPLLEDFGPALSKLGEAFGNVWRVLEPLVALLGGALLLALKVVTRVIRETLGPVLDFIVDVVYGIVRIIRGVLRVLVGLFTGDWKMLWDGLVDIVVGALALIGTIFKTAGLLIWGIVKGIVMGVWDFFAWLADELVGHSIIPDMINAIIDVFGWLVSLVQWLWKNVIKPIIEVFASAWPLVKTILHAWWAGIKAVWSVLKNVATWLWDNVLKPVFTVIKSLWNNFVQPALKAWWAGIKAVWSVLKAVATWLWDNVLKPVFNKIRDLWSDWVKPDLALWWSGIKTVWDKLTGLGEWVWDNVMSPVVNAFKDGWTKIKEWFEDNGDLILKPFQTVVKGIITAINWVIKGLNKLDALPGISISITELKVPEFAAGGNLPGRRVGGGFRTSGARAIVGEGKPNYPEYVIPTDPTYRRRAQMLYAQAGQRLGMQAVPAHADGGVLGTLGDVANAVTGTVVNVADAAFDKVQDAGKFAMENTMKPFFALAREAAEMIDWKIGEQAAKGAINVVEDWIKGAQKVYTNQFEEAAQSMGGGDVFVPDPGNPRGLTTWNGGTFTNKFVAHMIKAQQLANDTVRVMQGGFRPTTSYSGTSHQGDAVDFQVSNALINAFRRVGIAAGDRTGLGSWAPHVHAVPGPGAGYAAGSAVWQFQDYLARGGAAQSLNSPWGLAEGGIVRRKAGGTLITAGEGGSDEAVIPLPPNWRTSVFGNGRGEGTTVIEINGDLSFPNIENGDDAKAFIENLKILAKD